MDDLFVSFSLRSAATAFLYQLTKLGFPKLSKRRFRDAMNKFYTQCMKQINSVGARVGERKYMFFFFFFF